MSGRCSTRSVTTPAATSGSRSAATAGSTGPGTRPARWSDRFAEAGVERLMLQDFIPWDLDHIDVMGEELIGRV